MSSELSFWAFLYFVLLSVPAAFIALLIIIVEFFTRIVRKFIAKKESKDTTPRF